MSDLIPQILPILYIVVIAIMLLFAFMYYKFLKRERKNMALLLEQQADLIEKNDELDKLFKKVETIKKEWERTADSLGEIKNLNLEIKQKNTEIMESIRYASMIQSAILPSGDYINQILPYRFILYKPKDIVSGDFYWITRKENKIIAAAADCTGHGVPGAFMSMLGVTFLNEIVNEKNITNANEILNHLRESVINSLHQTGKEGETQDGMDIALIIIDDKKREMQYAGANNPLYLVRNKTLTETKADKMPIGIHDSKNRSFTNHIIPVEKDDSIYIFSDGFADQFGGPNGKKFKYQPYKDLLVNIQDKPMMEQKEILDTTINSWMGNNEQVDDIIIIGIKIA